MAHIRVKSRRTVYVSRVLVGRSVGISTVDRVVQDPLVRAAEQPEELNCHALCAEEDERERRQW